MRRADPDRSLRRSLHRYCLYGLELESEWPLKLAGGAYPCFGKVALRTVPASFFSAARDELARRSKDGAWVGYVRLADGSDYARWLDHFEFLIHPDGRRISGRFLGPTSLESFRTYLLGAVLSYSLIKLGVEPIHSTTVVIGGEAVSLLGDSGYGKSVLGSAFMSAGYPLLTDDLLVLREAGAGYLAYPGHPRVKLFPEDARKLLGEESRGKRMNQGTAKLIIPLDKSRFHLHPAPLKAIYAIVPPFSGRGRKKVTIRRLSRRAGFLKLLKNTYNTRQTERERLSLQFSLASRLSSAVPIKSLSYPRSIRALPDVVDAVLSDLGVKPDGKPSGRGGRVPHPGK